MASGNKVLSRNNLCFAIRALWTAVCFEAVEEALAQHRALGILTSIPQVDCRLTARSPDDATGSSMISEEAGISVVVPKPMTSNAHSRLGAERYF